MAEFHLAGDLPAFVDQSMEESAKIKTEPMDFTVGNANAFSSTTSIKNNCDSDKDLVVVTNGDIVDFFKEHKHKEWKVIIELFKQEFGLHENNSSSGPHDMSIYKNLKSIYSKAVYNLRGKKKDEFLKQEYIRVRNKAMFLSDKFQESPRKKALREKLELSEKRNRDLKRKLDTSIEELEKLDQELDQITDDYKHDIARLSFAEQRYSQVLSKMLEDNVNNAKSQQKYSTQLKQLQTDYESAQAELRQAEIKLKSTQTKKLNEKLKARTSRIKKQQNKIKDQNKTIKENNETLQQNEIVLNQMQEELKTKGDEINKLKKQKQNLQMQLSYYKKTNISIKETVQIIKDKVEDDKIDLELKRKNLELKEKELDYLETLLNDEKIQTFADGKYSDDVRLTIMELLSMNVSLSKVNDVIRTVLSRLAHKDIDRLPSKALKSQLLIEARHLADIQIGEAMLSGIDLNSVLGNTLHGDGTSKYHRHFQNFQINTVDGVPLSLGLVEIVEQDAATLLITLKERIADIAKAVCGNNSDDVTVSDTVNRLLVSVKNTMSDHCATNGAFNTLLESLRKELLPTVISNWESLTDDEKECLGDMGNFFCKVHPLISFAEECNKVLLKFEAASSEGKSKHALPHSGESGAVRLIRTTCAAFQKRGHQAAGMSADFSAYLSEINVQMSLIQMEGNRFNIVFHNGAATYFHRLHIHNFIDSKVSQNRLLKAVSEDLSNTVYLAGIRALGIISKLVTGPYFRIVGATKSILEMNPHLLQLQLSMERLSKNAQPLLEAEPIFSEELAPIVKNDVYFELFKTSEDEEFQILTQQALELLCAAILVVLERQCDDQLPGGRYWMPSDNLKLQASNVVTSNIISERDFARFDNLLKSKPNATVTALEATIMWCNNKPSEWLDKMSESERKERHQQARDNVQMIKEKMRTRRKEILQTRLRKIEEEHRKKEEEKEKLVRKKLNLTLEIEKKGGLWKNPAQAKQMLSKIKTERLKIDAVYSQLQFHNIVLNSVAPKTYYFQKSHTDKGRKIDFSSLEMLQHLVEILSLNMEGTTAAIETNLSELIDKSEAENSKLPFTIVEKEVREGEFLKQKQELAKKLIEARMKRESTKSKNQLDLLLENPNKLTGCRFKHKVQETKDDPPEWFDGTVIKIDEHSEKNPIKTVYEIQYDIDGIDEFYSFALLTELKNGNLVIIS